MARVWFHFPIKFVGITTSNRHPFPHSKFISIHVEPWRTTHHHTIRVRKKRPIWYMKGDSNHTLRKSITPLALWFAKARCNFHAAHPKPFSSNSLSWLHHSPLKEHSEGPQNTPHLVFLASWFISQQSSNLVTTQPIVCPILANLSIVHTLKTLTTKFLNSLSVWKRFNTWEALQNLTISL